MNTFRRTIAFLTHPFIVLHILFFIQLAIFLWTVIHPYTIEPQGSTYLYLRGHLVYTSYIRQAKDGAWSLFMSHTTRPMHSIYTPMFFVALGKIAAIFNIDPPVIYMASRIFASYALFLAVYWLVKVIIPKKLYSKTLHISAILFILALEPGPFLTDLGWNPMLWKPAIFSYYPQVAVQRHFGLPHHTMGEAVGLLFLGLFFLFLSKPTLSRLWLLFVTGIAGTLILPPYFTILGIVVFIPWILYAITDKSFRKMVIPLLVSGLAVGGTAFFVYHEISKGYPYKWTNLDEKRWVANADVLINYLSSLILYVPFISLLWISILRLWRSFDANLRRLISVATSWIIIPPILVPVSSLPWFPMANFRLMDGYNYVPAGILAAFGVSYGMKIFKSRAVIGLTRGFLVSGVIFTSTMLTYIYTAQIIKDQRFFWNNVYLDNSHWRAFSFLRTVPKWSGIIVMNHFGEIIPEFASVKTFLGSTPGFSDWEERFHIATSFYSGLLTDDQARTTLQKEHISFVYYSDEERYYNISGTLYPNILTPIFDEGIVMIYKVK